MTGNEQQARKDAMADAETLRRMSRAFYPHAIHDPIYHASGAGSACLIALRECPSEAPLDARTAAHAAFRAVPGLRGDR